MSQAICFKHAAHSLAALLLAALALPAQADGLRDLKSALSRLQGQTPLKGQLQVKSEQRSNEGKDDAETRHGAAQIQFDDGPQGLRLVYPSATLSRAAQEEAAREANNKAPSPTARGLNSLGYNTVLDMARAAEAFQRELTNATFKGERADTHQGQPARLVSLEIQPKKLDKYVKDFKHTLDVWMAADGTPLAAKSRQTIAGRAMMVISFEMTAAEEYLFSVIGDRLVALRKTVHSSGSGAGEKGQQRSEYVLVPS